jgi:hypothetical protein
MPVMSNRQLIRLIKDYASYFNQARPHQVIAQRIPAPRVSPPEPPKPGKVTAIPVLNGLHHAYRRVTA